MHLVDRIVLSGYNTQCLSLNHGLMGKVLFFYKLARCTGRSHYREYAELLLQELHNAITKLKLMGFMDGLAGVGWCLQYLISCQLEAGDADDILEELDIAIMTIDPLRIRDTSFENGLWGLVAYVRARLEWQKSSGMSTFDIQYQKRVLEACRQYGMNMYSSDFDLNAVYGKIIDHYEASSCKERTIWENGLILLERGQGKVAVQNEFSTKREKAKAEMPCVLIFSQSCRAANYGVGTYVEQLSSCLVSAGWEVFVLELDSMGEKVESCIKNGVRYYQVPHQNTKGNQRQYNYAQFVIQKFISKAENLVCHFNFAYYPLMAERVRKALSAKILFTLHFTSWSFDLLGDKDYLYRILKKQENDREYHVYVSFLDEQKFMRDSCDHVIAIARHSYDMIRDVYAITEQKLSLIPNGRACVKCTRSAEANHKLRQKYGFKDDEKILVFCGRLDSVKGIIELLDVFRILSKEIANLRLVIIGEGNFDVCIKYAEDLWNKIVFTGFLGSAKIQEFYVMSDIGIVPSIHEEFGYVALEMMMAGLPIVANSTTGLRDLTENGKYGLLYNRRDAQGKDGLLHTLKRVLGGQQIIPMPNLEVLKQKYSQETFKEKIVSLYNNIAFR